MRGRIVLRRVSKKRYDIVFDSKILGRVVRLNSGVQVVRVLKKELVASIMRGATMSKRAGELLELWPK